MYCVEPDGWVDPLTLNAEIQNDHELFKVRDQSSSECLSSIAPSNILAQKNWTFMEKTGFILMCVFNNNIYKWKNMRLPECTKLAWVLVWK
jgi:hypothetical protein